MRSIFAVMAVVSVVGCGSKNDGAPKLADPAQADPRLKAADAGAGPRSAEPARPAPVEDMPVKKKAKFGE